MTCPSCGGELDEFKGQHDESETVVKGQDAWDLHRGSATHLLFYDDGGTTPTGVFFLRIAFD